MEFLQIPWLVKTYVFIIGLAVGSFLNVCIWRLPQGKSIIFPSSHCPKCNATIPKKHNIPLISYIFLSGKCRFCNSSISSVYPIVEITNAFLLVALYNKFGWNWQMLIYSVVICALVVITLIDFEHKIIPDAITLPGIIFGLSAGIFLVGFRNSITGFFVGGGIFYFLAVISNGGLGGGDIKFIAGIGALLGWQKVLLVIFLGASLGSCVGLVLILIKKKRPQKRNPFWAIFGGRHCRDDIFRK